MIRTTRKILGAAAGFALVVAAGIAVAQYRVNNQIYGNTSSSVRYGRSYQANYANQPTYNLLPSENRNLMARSGALPSTIRMNYASVGPLAPQGVRAYVPEPASYRSSAVAAGNYVNTMAPTRINNAPVPATPVANRIPSNPAAVGSMRYSLPTPSAAPVSGFSVNSSLPAGGAASSSLWQQSVPSAAAVKTTPQSGSIKYSWNLGN